MKIAKSLKYADFEWDDESKSFTITEEDGNRVILNKVYAFAFMRFAIRMAQRNWFKQAKKSKKELDKTDENVVSSIFSENQMSIFEGVEDGETMGIQSGVQEE
jgi:hypothetical protein|tara:strand:+ start:250 stop:558 length:309 start_codon:yes stop_codon:yes gene_type:complete